MKIKLLSLLLLLPLCLHCSGKAKKVDERSESQAIVDRMIAKIAPPETSKKLQLRPPVGGRLI